MYVAVPELPSTDSHPFRLGGGNLPVAQADKKDESTDKADKADKAGAVVPAGEDGVMILDEDVELVALVVNNNDANVIDVIDVSDGGNKRKAEEMCDDEANPKRQKI